jgi:hypothetical protein
MTKAHVFDPAKLTVQSFFATIHITYIGNLLFRGIDAKGDIQKHPSAIAEALELGKKLIQEFDNPDFKISEADRDINIEHDRK